jgi:hypothetical protein
LDTDFAQISRRIQYQMCCVHFKIIIIIIGYLINHHFQELHEVVANWLKQHLDYVSLSYRLGINEGKICIESNEELVMFISRMCSIIIPLCHCDGKQSTHPPKAVEVCFEAASMDNAEDTHNSSGKGQSNSKSNRLVSTITVTVSSHW